jgi:uncharacterized protein (TIGR03067 family)
MIILSAVLLLIADEKTEAEKQEMKNLQGAWVVVSAERDGKPDDDLKGARFTFEGDAFTRKTSSGTVHGTYRLDPKQSPKETGATFTDGPLKGKKVFGIYAVDGDTLKLCYSEPGKNAPLDFTSKAGSGHLLVVLKRDKEP